MYTLGKNLGLLVRLEGGLVFVQSVLTTLKYYLFWVLRVGNKGVGGDVIIDTKQKYFVVKILLFHG